ncbi:MULTISPECIES: Crp/Fnr family transcriptional regulator [Sphingobacterium]|uniref:Crp/Fnr family transcriptional regulator n=1 Tax=Sphingobacterium TaxID=28453 RepID=UPI00257A1EDE|nr:MULTISPECIES: Crp/Fnr family transcriptional regulator [Sphingobacterium]
MLRTNQSFLDRTTALYRQQQRQEDIVIRKYIKGQNVYHQGVVSTKVMVISEGIAKCYFTEANDKEYIVEFLSTGEIIGEIECIRPIPSLCSIQAMTDVTVYAFSKAYFRKLLESDITLSNMLLDIMAQRIVHTSSRASYQQLYSLEHSLSRLLEIQSQQDIVIKKEDMAAYLGISVRSLNRELKKLL